MGKLVVFSILAVFAIGSAIGCPKVDSLRCLTQQPVDEDCRVQTFIKLNNGKECPGCQICLQPEEQAGSVCPRMACPMWQPERSCRPKYYSQYFTLNPSGEECTACGTYQCKSQKKKSKRNPK